MLQSLVEQADEKRTNAEAVCPEWCNARGKCLQEHGGSRMKKGKVRWSSLGAQAINALRCSMKSGQYDEAIRLRRASSQLN